MGSDFLQFGSHFSIAPSKQRIADRKIGRQKKKRKEKKECHRNDDRRAAL
jgi:hypothetical protein